jgi:hypothetical protein
MIMNDTMDTAAEPTALSCQEIDAVAGGYEQVIFCRAPAPHLQAFLDGFAKGGGTTNGCPGGFQGFA